MNRKQFPVIDPVATGKNIIRLRTERGMAVRDLQSYFGFEEPQAIYKWQQGKSLPSVDNLYALGALFEVPMEDILISRTPKLNLIICEQQAEPARNYRRVFRQRHKNFHASVYSAADGACRSSIYVTARSTYSIEYLNACTRSK